MTDTPPPRPPFEVAHIDEIPHTPSNDSYGFQLSGDWKQLRHFFGIREFGANAFVATAAGQEIVHEHVERPNDDQDPVGAEELYYVAAGSATVTLDGESLIAGPGTFVFVGEPSVRRKVVADEVGTTVLAFGTKPGVRFVISRFEAAMSPAPRWSLP